MHQLIDKKNKDINIFNIFNYIKYNNKKSFKKKTIQLKLIKSM